MLKLDENECFHVVVHDHKMKWIRTGINKTNYISLNSLLHRLPTEIFRTINNILYKYFVTNKFHDL